MCRALFSGPKFKDRQGHMGQFKFWPCLLHGFFPIWLNHFTCGIHTTHEGPMCCTPFSESKVEVTQAVEAITLSALWLPPYCLVKQSLGLTHWGRGKIAAISQMTFPNAFSLMKMEQFHLTFSLKFVLKVQTKSQEGIRSFTDNYSLSEPMMVSLPTHICVTWPQWVKKMKPLYNSGLIQLHLP